LTGALVERAIPIFFAMTAAHVEAIPDAFPNAAIRLFCCANLKKRRNLLA